MSATTSQRRRNGGMASCCLLLIALVPCSEALRFLGGSPLSLGFLPRVGPRKDDGIDGQSTTILLQMRGGDEEVLTLDEKVRKAMVKLGLAQPEDVAVEDPPKTEEQPQEATAAATTTATDSDAPPTQSEQATESPPSPPAQQEEQLVDDDMDVEVLADKIADDMNVHPSLAMAALGATSTVDTANPASRKYNEAMARSMIQQELGMIDNVSEDSEEVKQLVSEGYDTFLSRRALAFADKNMDDARAILLADKLDEEEEQRIMQQQSAPSEPQEEEPAMKTVNVDKNFDPASIGAKPAAPAPAPQLPKAARKEDVVFEATTAQLQELVIESPVPVLLDIYADWCGPCKVLGPALEDMAVKSGGLFRVVKINSDNEKPVSAALEVTALPTVFGIKDGKIEHMFQGMPKSEDHMKNFMMGLLMPGGKFNPPVTPKEAEKYMELSSRLAKTAGAASFSFAARELLQDRTSAKLDALVEAQNGDLLDTEETVQILRSLLSNIIRAPYDQKFRKLNLANKVLAEKVAKFQPCLAILKSVGFAKEGSDTLVIGKGKRAVNVAPLTVARDYLDKWIDKTRYDVAKAARKRKDELALKELEASGALEEEEEEEEEEEDVDPNKCELKVRLEGKKKIHEIAMHADDPLSKLIESLPILSSQEEEMQITCVAKRLVVKSTDKAAMKKSLRDCGLLPTAALVVKVGAGAKRDASSKSSLAERAAVDKKRKKGSHTMHSIGVYAKDDHLKGEMIDGGGGVLYEQDVTDDEDETPEGETTEDASSSPDEGATDEGDDSPP